MLPYERVGKVLRIDRIPILHGPYWTTGTVLIGSSSSAGARSVLAGPFTTFPSALKREP